MQFLVFNETLLKTRFVKYIFRDDNTDEKKGRHFKQWRVKARKCRAKYDLTLRRDFKWNTCFIKELGTSAE